MGLATRILGRTGLTVSRLGVGGYLGLLADGEASESRCILTVSTKVGTHPERRHGYDRDAVRFASST